MKLSLLHICFVFALVPLATISCSRGKALYVEADLRKINDHGYQSPKAGMLYDAKIAADVAYAYLINIMGKDKIDAQLPLRIALVDDTWVVECSPALKNAAGGTLHIEISRSDGRILLMHQSL